MICHSYDQLTIVEKRQFIGKLMHLIQSDEKAFIEADQLIREADKDGIFKSVTILPVNNAPFNGAKKESGSFSYNYTRQTPMLKPHSQNFVFNFYNRTRDSLQRSYHKLFSGLAG